LKFVPYDPLGGYHTYTSTNKCELVIKPVKQMRVRWGSALRPISLLTIKLSRVRKHHSTGDIATTCTGGRLKHSERNIQAKQITAYACR